MHFISLFLYTHFTSFLDILRYKFPIYNLTLYNFRYFNAEENKILNYFYPNHQNTNDKNILHIF